MTTRIQELIKKYKSDISVNNFNGIIRDCYVADMSELLDIFAEAGIDIPDGTYKTYANVCCYIDTLFKSAGLQNIHHHADYTDFEFIAATRKNFNVIHTDNFEALGARLIRCSEEDRLFYITIRIDK